MPEQLSYTQLIARILRGASRPLTVNEILGRLAPIRPVETRDPAATVRSAMNSEHRIVTLGGRPAHYTWWPRHLTGSTFRLPLRTSDLEQGTLVLTEEGFDALWPDFLSGPFRTEKPVTLELANGPALRTQVARLETGRGDWGFCEEPVLAAWLAGQGAVPEHDLILRVVDADPRRYLLSLERETDAEAIRARNHALADVAERVLRAGRGPMPYFDLIPRTIGHGAYRDPVPPEPMEEVLRADLRFAGGPEDAVLVERVVAEYEEDMEVLPRASAAPAPRGRPPWRGKGAEGYDDKTRRAWAAYLVDRGIDHVRIHMQPVAEAYWRLALQLDATYVRARADVGRDG